ncbi:hypothetical protein P152DRAFT_462973, partial [Eremomyces bilateralis CBS 781.70]
MPKAKKTKSRRHRRGAKSNSAPNAPSTRGRELERILDIPGSELASYIKQLVRAKERRVNIHDEVSIDDMLSMQVKIIESTLRRLLRDRYPQSHTAVEPKDLQIAILSRLIFAKQDTILIAQTGFGKSL